ncbi:hypothetical protein [Hyphomicrobium sp.]|uniref:hypothetical protein n=1 Tax=Hyphomicrobium sp. TaxID=82 RepID=UPI00356A4D71
MPVSVTSGGPAPRTRAKPKYRRLMLRPMLDAAIAGVAFTLISSAVICNHARAGTTPAAFAGIERVATQSAVMAVAEPGPLPIVQIATASSSADAVYRQTSTTAAWSLLGVAFSMMTALNLALLRHLKRAYATPTRRYPLVK